MTENLNLVLAFTLAGNSDRHIRGAARIKVDGQGGLMVYAPEAGIAERIDLAEVRSLSIHPMGCAGRTDWSN